MVHELDLFTRGLSIGLLGLGFLYLSALSIWDRFIRLKAFNYIGLAFFFMSGGTLLHLLPLIFANHHHWIFALSTLLNGMALIFMWLHFQLMRNPSLKLVLLSITLIPFSGAITLITIYLFFTPQRQLLGYSFILLTIVGVITLTMPMKMTFRDYLIRDDFFSLFEGLCFLFLLISLFVHDLYYFNNPPAQLLLIADLALVIGAGGLIILYTWYPRLMHRIPFKIWFLLGFHDSGLFFYRKEINLHHLGSNNQSRRMHFLPSMLTVIDAMFKHLLSQEVVHTIQKSKNIELLFIRDPNKKIGYLLIAEKHSYYLKQALETLLRLTPSSICQANPNINDKENEAAFIINRNRVEFFLRPLIEKLFPGIEQL